MPAIKEFDPPAGVPMTLAPGLRRILAPNPAPMTFRGTNTYLLGERDLAVIDPGPADDAHLDAILSALAPRQRISHIVVTHTHLDHSPLARPLAKRCGAPVLAFGGPEAGRSAIMRELSASGLVGGGEGIDHEFRPDIELSHDEVIKGDGWTLDVIHTPGHLGNHIALGWDEACFTADHVMGWASSLVSPPDGDLTDFMASCHKLASHRWSVFHPGHGAPVDDPHGRLEWLIRHRLSRESEILDALAMRSASAQSLAQQIYHDTAPALLPAATRNVFAHLIDLYCKNSVEPLSILSPEAQFRRL